MNKIKSLYAYTFLFVINKLRFGKFGFKSRVGKLIKLEKPKNIYIGNQVSVGQFSWLAANPLAINKKPILEIQDNTYIGNFAHIYCVNNIIISDNVLIADKVYITDNLHNYHNINLPIIKQEIIQLSPIKINSGAWIGENVCIIGVNIGKNSVIGANSVVTKDIPDYCIAVGSPAKIIKRYSFEKQEWLKTDKEGNFLNL